MRYVTNFGGSLAEKQEQARLYREVADATGLNIVIQCNSIPGFNVPDVWCLCLPDKGPNDALELDEFWRILDQECRG